MSLKIMLPMYTASYAKRETNLRFSLVCLYVTRVTKLKQEGQEAPRFLGRQA